ncbi:DUF6879 family protein [Allonocardiopsis opalescens]|uniref:DUF6879 domain-containing protein n=1 Tax=Allonocardiopsis opalescens TaxID=1144618 RepID=A0A2T0QA97_9ACTN|nr:DUF6879 family protein [Allonocardiopsis opalescens]PRY00836.1 hypothetical protein CLV72_102468 [Allonocardiopsis opalescens]
MLDRITGPQITEFFKAGFEHTAWRLETRRAYGVASETEEFQAWLRGEPAEPDPQRPWLATMRALRSAGKRVERVRIIDDPPTDYQRWLLSDVADSIDAGEDIRYLARADAGLLPHAPHSDFWLFDSKTIGIFAFDGDRSLGMRLTDDPDQVLKGCQIRDAAWHFARPATVFIPL